MGGHGPAQPTRMVLASVRMPSQRSGIEKARGTEGLQAELEGHAAGQFSFDLQGRQG